MKNVISEEQKEELREILAEQKKEYKNKANNFSSKEDIESSIFGDDDLVEVFFNENSLDEDYVEEFRDIQHDIVENTLEHQIGNRVKFSFGEDDLNLTSENKAAYIADIIEINDEMKDFFEVVLEGTRYEGVDWSCSAVQDIMGEHMNNWSREDIDRVYSSIPDDETIKSLAEFVQKEDFNDFNHDVDIDYETNNFRSLSDSISNLANLSSLVDEKISEIAPSYIDDYTFNDRVEKDIIEATTPMYGFAYKLAENEFSVNDSRIQSLFETAPDISIAKQGKDYFITSNSSEMDMEQVCNAYKSIDGELPKALINTHYDALMKSVNANQKQALKIK